MAKALMGHVGLAPDMRLLAEVRRLRARVNDLEAEVARLRAANTALSSGLRVDDVMITLEVPDTIEHEPALT